MIIVLSGFQPGTGKSVLAQSLAAYLKVELSRDVVLVDCDPSQESTRWAQKRRDSGLPLVKCIQLQYDMLRQLKELAQSYETVIVDSSIVKDSPSDEIYRACDHLLFPVRPQWQDLNYLPEIEKLISSNKENCNNAMISLTQCPVQPGLVKKVRAAKALCKTHQLTVLSTTISYQAEYVNYQQEGATVIDKAPQGHGAWEIRNLLNEVLAKSMGIKFAQLVENQNFNWLKQQQ